MYRENNVEFSKKYTNKNILNNPEQIDLFKYSFQIVPVD